MRHLAAAALAATTLFAAPLAAQDHAAHAALLHPNTATEAQLARVAGFTTALAKAVVAKRPYARMADFDAVVRATLDSAASREAYKHVFVPIDLNTATDAEILMIPGAGRRVLREFKEYRPYKAMAQFAREMGKYWDKDEVGRLAKYVKVQ
jgi:DNA uptake protein ComE-like DNA-binding protein